MKIIHALAAALLLTQAVSAQEYPLQQHREQVPQAQVPQEEAAQDQMERPRPLTATLIGVCEKRVSVLMVAIFTYSNGKVLLVSRQHLNGFKDTSDIARYASQAESINEMAQPCGDTTT